MNLYCFRLHFKPRSLRAVRIVCGQTCPSPASHCRSTSDIFRGSKSRLAVATKRSFSSVRARGRPVVLPGAAAARGSANDSTSHAITSLPAGCLACRRGSCRHRGVTEGVAVIKGCQLRGLPKRRGSTVGGLPLLWLFALAYFSARLQIVEIETLTFSAMSGWHICIVRIATRRVGVMVGPA